jgi:NitT/TauT family transport system substrate-binding protein
MSRFDILNTVRRRRDVLRGGMSIAAASGLGGAALIFPKTGKAANDLYVQFDWLMGNGQIGDIVALKKGLFAEQGLNVTFNPGGPNAQTVPPVLSGQALMGQFSSTSQAMIAYGAGRPVRVFACGYQVLPFAYISLPRAPIRKPEDFIGKKVATQPTARLTLDLILSVHHIDPSKLEIVNMGFDMTPLVTGQVDCVTGFITNTKAMSVIGPDRIIMTAESAGVTSYANVYFVADENFAMNKDTIAKVLSAIAKGWEWSFHNRKAAVDIMCDAYPNLDREVEHQTVDLVMQLSFDEATRKNGWGWFENERLERQIKLFDGAKRFETRVPTPESLATREILTMTAATRPKLG